MTYSSGRRLAAVAIIVVLALAAGAVLSGFVRWLQVGAWVIGVVLVIGVLWPPAIVRPAAGLGWALGTALRPFRRPRPM